jgi:hypothetical protein
MTCRCHINVKTYAKQASKGGPLKGYKPCPVHEREADPVCICNDHDDPRPCPTHETEPH